MSQILTCQRAASSDSLNTISEAHLLSPSLLQGFQHGCWKASDVQSLHRVRMLKCCQHGVWEPREPLSSSVRGAQGMAAPWRLNCRIAVFYSGLLGAKSGAFGLHCPVLSLRAFLTDGPGLPCLRGHQLKQLFLQVSAREELVQVID